MAFTNDPGFGQLFRNKYKEKESQPDHKGQITDPEGNVWDIAAWIKEGANGKFFSLRIQEPYKKDDAEAKPDPNFVPDEDIPF